MPLLTPGAAVAAGGCALVPCRPCGFVFDLLEAVVAHLSALQINTVPVYFISPAAKSAIAYANIFGNWYGLLCLSVQHDLDHNKEKIFAPLMASTRNIRLLMYLIWTCVIFLP